MIDQEEERRTRDARKGRRNERRNYLSAGICVGAVGGLLIYSGIVDGLIQRKIVHATTAWIAPATISTATSGYALLAISVGILAFAWSGSLIKKGISIDTKS